MERRKASLVEDFEPYVGATMVLSDAEARVDALLRAARDADLASYEPVLPAQHFFAAKAKLESGQLFPMIRALPKGAALHLHIDSLIDHEWLVKNAT